MNNLKISVITVNYNNCEGLRRTMASVQEQTYANLEYIVIDGGSTDGSAEAIPQSDPQPHYWVSEQDAGIYQAMNKGIRASHGKYLLFLNSGDVFHRPDVVEKAVAEMSEGLDIYYGDALYDHHGQPETRIYPDRLDFDFFYVQNLSHQATFIARSLFDRISFYNESYRIVSDWEFFSVAICKHQASYRHLAWLITIYDVNGISSDQENYPTMNAERDAVFERHFQSFASNYSYLQTLKFKKLEQFLYIKTYPFSYKVLKAFMNFILLFLPRFRRQS
ncbi:glycosyltransferase [Pedobacter yulinensis]|uniref:Glycosyltransferase n=1 Tax=Pedobacter yulinensis TaxID=2126353 RepID=A0A2T3HR59_9SPHI|nr:glycosyltransferase family 2 protein [Pedobacter yulinensis]PST84877.1 glycosyltransferase [Pedobacter yulinensis]